ncbi:cardiolipin synthase [Sphingomonas jejuensis]|uniref:Phospholipase D n=1 Tax=Sphingomonas jejuensis TaxID=904715 RepID=A0ABX0XH80_9SPHN|nr:phosphatidylserine/phosphatidylglycerophosphate/cardiolipin synthase family protein [Sphingomonas jejuensis]NJC32683.1 cardiolipin synthase [Sphingomonas jejuensis]
MSDGHHDDHSGGAVRVAGNRLDLLETGPEQRAALLSLIEGARRTLRLLYYIYAEDESGRAVRDALVVALKRGVEVRLIVDGFGSDADDSFFAPLREAGGTVCRFHPTIGRRYLLRNHQKLACADETIALVGGFNVEDDYFRTVEDGGWRDLGLSIAGPAVLPAVHYFDALFDWTAQKRSKGRDLRRRLQNWNSGDETIRWLLGGPARRLSPWLRTIRNDLQVARHFWMIAAYFAPGPYMLRRLERAGRRGDVRVITASKSDNGATIGAARFLYRGLLKKQVRVFEYQPTKLHSKLFVIDDLVYIGSANFDIRSLHLNLEIMVRIRDRDFADRMRRYFDEETAQSREIALDEVSGWGSVFQRLRWGAAYFLVAIVDYNVTRRLNFGLDGSEL